MDRPHCPHTNRNIARSRSSETRRGKSPAYHRTRLESQIVKLCGHVTEPFIPSCEIGASLVCAIDISTPPQSALLRCYCIDNHASHCPDSRRVKPADEQQRCILQIADRAETLEIRIRRHARNLTRIKSEHSQLRINRGFVATSYWTRSRLITRIGRG